MSESTQFAIGFETKNKLDLLKARKKTEILTTTKSKRRLVTNTMVIEYLLGVETAHVKLKEKQAKAKEKDGKEEKWKIGDWKEKEAQ